jgi:hypothetical protein
MNPVVAQDGEFHIFASESLVPDTRPVILTPGQHRDDGDIVYEIGNDVFAQRVLESLPPTTLFRMDTVVGELLGAPGHRRLREVTEHRMRGIVDAHVKLAKWVRRKDQPPSQVYVACSRDLAAVLLAQAPATGLIQELRLLTPYPVYLDDFTLVRPGWNPNAAVYYDEPPDLVGLVPHPSPSLDPINDLLVDFPFGEDVASKHNAIGFVFTIVLRPAIDGHIPFHLLTAPLERTGKGKLIDALAGRLVLGTDVPVLQPGRNEEEREKRITALILRGATVVHFDNLPTEEVFDSAAFASLATTRIWMGRLLGKSQVPQLPNTLIPVLSGNNTRASGELTKRIVPIKLHPQTDRPEERSDFVHEDIDAYVIANRRAVLSHVLGFVETWKTAGRPVFERTRMGGFEQWVRIAGGVTTHAGATSWMENYRDWVSQGDEFAADAARLLAQWLTSRGMNEVSATELMEIVRDIGVFPHVTSRKPEGQLVCLARSVLSKLENRPVDNFMVKARGTGSSKRYRLQRID